MSTPPFEIRGWHVLSALLAFFAVVIAVNVSFAVIAIRSFPGEDVRRSYLQGIQFNNTLAERRAQAALGWEATTILRAQEGEAILEVTLRDRNGGAINAAEITGVLQWPTTANFDRTLVFTSIGDDRYEARLGVLAHGRWRLRARAESGAGALDFESEMTWPS